MSKGIKTVIQVASLAAGAYGAYTAISGMATAAGGVTQAGTLAASSAAGPSGLNVAAGEVIKAGATGAAEGAIGSGLGSKMAGLVTQKNLQMASMGLQGLSSGMQMVAQAEMQDQQEEQERMQAKILERQEQKRIVEQIRMERIQRGRAEAGAANVGGGTAPAATIAGNSSIVGGLGALGMQSAANQQEIRFGASGAKAVGAAYGAQQTAANWGNNWAKVGKFGETMWNTAPGTSSWWNQNIFA